LLPAERELEVAMAGGNERNEKVPPTLAGHASRVSWEGGSVVTGSDSELFPSSSSEMRTSDIVNDPCSFFPTPAQLSQLKLASEDHETLPIIGAIDINGQQIDLRTNNSWRLKLIEVQLPELAEVFAINAMAPFIINARLQPLLEKSARLVTGETSTSEEHGKAFIVNVSAMEGKFYRHKTPNHPHTNMAKAALNMMTRTSAAELAEKHNIYMTAVDTGWINDENPRQIAARTADVHDFQTPIDEVDAAARVLHPVFHGSVPGNEPLRGLFLKDYVATEW
jgi:NAD(P)-dependent dehydrogenase (short-subunit alcohol dehydrogenase family)